MIIIKLCTKILYKGSYKIFQIDFHKHGRTCLLHIYKRSLSFWLNIVLCCNVCSFEFLMECLADLRNNLMRRGLNLLIRSGEPEDILPSLAKEFGAHTVKSFFCVCACAESFRCFLKMFNFV